MATYFLHVSEGDEMLFDRDGFEAKDLASARNALPDRVGPATARFGDRRTTVVGLAGGALSFLAMGVAPSAAWFVAGLNPASLMGLAEPTLKAMLSRRVPESEQGQLQGAMQSLASMAGISGPVFFGWVYAGSSETAPGLSFVIAAGILAVAALLAWLEGTNRVLTQRG